MVGSNENVSVEPEGRSAATSAWPAALLKCSMAERNEPVQVVQPPPPWYGP